MGRPPVGAQTAVAPVDLPSSKQLLLPVPGGAQRLNSLPMSLAVSPDGRWVVSLNAGYGTFESGYAQSLAVLDTQTGAVKDFPDARVGAKAAQTLFSGLAFSADGTKVYASLASSSAPVGDGAKKTARFFHEKKKSAAMAPTWKRPIAMVVIQLMRPCWCSRPMRRSCLIFCATS